MSVSAHVKFRVAHGAAKAGETICVVGNFPCLGCWHPERALLLTPVEGEPGMFSASFHIVVNSSGEEHRPGGDLAPGGSGAGLGADVATHTMEYKYLIRDSQGAIQWEGGYNRELRLVSDQDSGASESKFLLDDTVRVEGASEFQQFEESEDSKDGTDERVLETEAPLEGAAHSSDPEEGPVNGAVQDAPADTEDGGHDSPWALNTESGMDNGRYTEAYAQGGDSASSDSKGMPAENTGAISGAKDDQPDTNDSALVMPENARTATTVGSSRDAIEEAGDSKDTENTANADGESNGPELNVPCEETNGEKRGHEGNAACHDADASAEKSTESLPEESNIEAGSMSDTNLNRENNSNDLGGGVPSLLVEQKTSNSGAKSWMTDLQNAHLASQVKQPGTWSDDLEDQSEPQIHLLYRLKTIFFGN